MFVQTEIFGAVRYVYQDIEEDVEVVIEGESNWVKRLISELSLDGKGWLQSIKSNEIFEISSLENESLILEDGNADNMGPSPDPSKIPIILRPVGSLDIDSKLEKYGAVSQEDPSMEDLAREFDKLASPEPKSGPLVQNPMSEAWLAELFKIALNQFGATSLPFDYIEAVASDKLSEMEGMELELWLEKLYRMGKLMKKTAGSEISFGPVPSWMNS